DVAQEPRRHVVGEDIAAPQARHVAIEALDIGEPAAEHDHVGVEKVDHPGERAREALDIAADRLAVEERHFAGAALLAGEAAVLAFEAGCAKIGFDAARASAIASR